MVNCEYCDYYKSPDSHMGKKNNGRAFCSFTNVVIITDIGAADAGYPCKNMSYQEYLNREKTPVNTAKLKPEDWKFIYKSRHYVTERNRSRNVI